MKAAMTSTTIVFGLLAATCSAFVAKDMDLSRRGKINSRTGPLRLVLTTFSAPVPYSYLGCYTEGTGVRALGSYNSINYTSMTVETCAELCTSQYTLFGLEYGGECWCANSFGTGSTLAPPADCSFPCAGNATELCGKLKHIFLP